MTIELNRNVSFFNLWLVAIFLSNSSLPELIITFPLIHTSHMYTRGWASWCWWRKVRNKTHSWFKCLRHLTSDDRNELLKQNQALFKRQGDPPPQSLQTEKCLRSYWRAAASAEECLMFSKAWAKQTRFPDANASSFKRIAMKANSPRECGVLYSRFHP